MQVGHHGAVYKLVSVVCHYGSTPQSGHYKVYLAPASLPATGGGGGGGKCEAKWQLANDNATFVPVKEQVVKNAAAYILCYKHVTAHGSNVPISLQIPPLVEYLCAPAPALELSDILCAYRNGCGGRRGAQLRAEEIALREAARAADAVRRAEEAHL